MAVEAQHDRRFRIVLAPENIGCCSRRTWVADVRGRHVGLIPQIKHARRAAVAGCSGDAGIGGDRVDGRGARRERSSPPARVIYMYVICLVAVFLDEPACVSDASSSPSHPLARKASRTATSPVAAKRPMAFQSAERSVNADHNDHDFHDGKRNH